MELVNQFFIELLATIVILTLLIIYLILKRSKVSKPSKIKKEPIENNLEKPTTVEDAYDDQDDAIFIKATEEPHEPVSEEKADINSQITTNRIKRELIPHGKITKDSFEEFKGMRILVAEDNLINQKVLTGLLSTSGIETIIANDGQEAMDILEEDTNFSLILMDAHMPRVDGFQATRFIRKNSSYEHIPIIVLSGDTAADDIKNMLKVGMEGHLEKPLKMDALYDVFYIYTTGNEEHEMQQTDAVKVSSVEFNVDKGLEICGGDKGFYLEILSDFLVKYSQAPKILQEYLKAQNAKGADKMLLDISGVAANIGADNLYHVTLELKKSIANPNDLEYVTALKSFKRSLDAVTKLINAYINS